MPSVFAHFRQSVDPPRDGHVYPLHPRVSLADRIFTAPAPTSMEFETGEKKIESLGTGCVALSAGDSACATESFSRGVSSSYAVSDG
jgi:hypothetical protein